jgi:hypothetical protein
MCISPPFYFNKQFFFVLSNIETSIRLTINQASHKWKIPRLLQYLGTLVIKQLEEVQLDKEGK